MKKYSQALGSIIAFLLLPCLNPAQAMTQDFVKTNGNALVIEGKRFIPRGVAHFDLESLWTAETQTPSDDWIKAEDFKSMKAAGFNSVRLSVKADYFMDDNNQTREENFRWLDKLINSAKDNGLKILLDMHVPAGGRQQDYQLNANSSYFWENPVLKLRQVMAWQEIAKRYRNETTIWGYELMNEPATLDFSAYESLMQQMAYAVRNFDRNHVLVIDAGMRLDAHSAVEYPYATVYDQNIARAVHFYEPVQFTLQGVSWGFIDNAIKSYPNPTYTKADLENAISEKVSEAKPESFPVVMTEFGLVFQTKHTGQAYWIRDVAEISDKLGMGWHYWYFKDKSYPLSMSLKTATGPVRPLTWSYLSSEAKRMP